VSISQKQQTTSLYLWLKVATIGLATPAKERIRVEIEAHYAEAVATHREEGLSESDASMAALVELGDPNKAAKSFRKKHLTAREAEQIAQAVDKANSYLWLMSCYLLFILGLFVVFCAPHRLDSWMLLSAGIFAGVIIPTFNFIMIRSKRSHPALLYLIQMIGFSLYVIILNSSSTRVLSAGGLLLIAAFGFFNISPSLRIWLKLRHIANVWTEIPWRNE
jgi:hypothetical protein